MTEIEKDLLNRVKSEHATFDVIRSLKDIESEVSCYMQGFIKGIDAALDVLGHKCGEDCKRQVGEYYGKLIKQAGR